MNSKVLLLSVAVIAIGLFAMPSTLSLFAGQHTFYNGSDVKCEKCHADIYSELSTGGGTAHTLGVFDQCEYCHKTNTTALAVPINGTNTSNYAGTNVTNNTQAHAAITLECITCHTGVEAEIQGTDAAHGAYYNASNASDATVKMKGANVACVGCHTHAYINVTWTRAVGYNITSTANSTGWDLNFSMNNSIPNVTYSAGE